MDDNRSYLSNGTIIILGYSNALKRAMVRLDVNILGLGQILLLVLLGEFDKTAVIYHHINI